MTGLALKTLTTSLLGGYEMDDTLFYSLLNVHKAIREGMRDWMKLKKTDTSLTASTSDTYLTVKAMPTDFGRWQKDRPIVLYETGTNNFLVYTEIPLSEKFAYQSESERFYCDYSTLNVYLTGTRDRNYTIASNYLKKSATLASGVSWVFGDLDAILAYDVASDYRVGIDYDDINARNAQQNMIVAQQLYKAMEMEDASLQVSSLRGVDRFGPGSRRLNGARININ